MAEVHETLDQLVNEIREKSPQAAAFGEAMADKSIGLWLLVRKMVNDSGLPHSEIAKRMRTSPAAVSRLLNRDNAGSIAARTLFKLEFATGLLALRYGDECEKCREQEQRHGFAMGAQVFGGWPTSLVASDVDESRTPYRKQALTALSGDKEARAA